MTAQTTHLKQLITSRRTIHDFLPNKFPDEKLIKDAIEVACWAPNHHLTEPWHFYLLGQETITSICELNRQIMTDKKGADNAEEKFLHGSLRVEG